MTQDWYLEGQQLLDWARQKVHWNSVGRGRLAEVAPRLFLGNKDAAIDRELLERHSVRAVVNVGAGPNAFEDAFKYHKIHVQDNEGASLLPHLCAACDFIHTAVQQGAVLVHCRGGMSRSPTVVIAFLLARRQLSIEQAVEVVRISRKCANPRREFLADLQEFMRELPVGNNSTVDGEVQAADLARRGSRVLQTERSDEQDSPVASAARESRKGGSSSSLLPVRETAVEAKHASNNLTAQNPSAAQSSFVKYEKMGEDSGPCGVEAGRKLPDAYVVTEKIHGANFCLMASRLLDTEVIEVQFANRTHVLGTTENAEDFFGCRSSGLLQSLKPLAAAALQRMDSEVRAVHIYGELFGGQYPHPLVAPTNSQPVQCGVWYAPGLHFQAFDVAVDVAGLRHFLDFAAARQACEACGLPFAASLHEGTLSECLEYPVEFETTIPSLLRLPKIAVAGDGTRNLAEGVVIRPLHEPSVGAVVIDKGSGKVSARGLFKRKIAAFSEKKYQNNGWREGKAGVAKKSSQSADVKQDIVKYEVEACVTEQRLNNVLSKTGHVDPQNKAACRQLLEDLKEDIHEALAEDDRIILLGSEILQHDLDQLCRKLVTKVLLRKRSAMP
jgi:Rnl2 family RNA ligase